jgi:phosphohistidine phosphatase
MELYILRHAIAAERGLVHYPNDDRPLTPDGIDKMKKGAEGIRAVVAGLDVIFTSPLQRARETAKITAQVFDTPTKIKFVKAMLPEAGTDEMLALLEKLPLKGRVMVVGHEPGLGKLASFLLRAEQPMIEFKKGSLCRIDLEPFPKAKKGKLIWHLTPKQLRLIGKSNKQ